MRSVVFLFSLIVLQLLVLTLRAQEIPVQLLLKLYPQQPYVYLNKSQVVDISIENTGRPVIKAHVHEKILISKSRFQTLRSKKVRTNASVEVKNVKGKLLVYDGKKHRSQNIHSIETQTESDGGSTFYDDDKYFYIGFPEAHEGDVVIIDYDVLYNEPRFFGGYFFSDYVPSIASKFCVSYPTGSVALKMKEFNFQNLNLKFTADSSKKVTTLQWTTDTVQALTDEIMDGSYKSKSSSVLICVDHFKTPTGIVPMGGSVSHLFSWYSEYLKNVDMSNDEVLRKFTDSLVGKAESNLDKLNILYTWVQNKIAYLAYEDGMNGFVPRDAIQVYTNKYGDCKDMANLLVRMCEFRKIPVYRAWIGTRDIPFQFTDFASPYCTNHMIAVYISGTDTIFIDPTGKNHPFALPTAMIQGKEALIYLGPGKFALSKVPQIVKEQSRELDSITIQLTKHNTIKGQGFYKMTGYEKLRVRGDLATISYEKQRQYVEYLVKKGNNKFKLDSFSVIPAISHGPLSIYYTFELPDYVVQNDAHILLNLNFNRDFFDDYQSDARRHNLEFSYRSVHEMFVSMEIQKNQQVDYIPENLNTGNSVMSISMNYSTKEHNVMLRNTISFEELNIKKEDIQLFHKIISDYNKQKSKLVSITNLTN